MGKVFRELLSDDSDVDPDFYVSKKQRELQLRAKRKRIENDVRYKNRSSSNRTSIKHDKPKLKIAKPMIPRLLDEKGPLVKNFCVGLQLLDDDFVRTALQGKLIWKHVYEKDDKITRRNRLRIQVHSKYTSGYLFKKTKTKKTTVRYIIKDENNNQIQDLNNNSNDWSDDEDDLNLDSNASYCDGYLNEDLNGLADNQLNNLLNQVNSQNNKTSNNTGSLLSENSSSSQLIESSLKSGKSMERFKERTVFGCRPSLENSSTLPSLSSLTSYKFRSSCDVHSKQELNLKNVKTILEVLKNLSAGELDENIRPIKCLSCSYTTTSIQNLFLHSSFHRNVCDFCKRSFKSVHSYFQHLNFHLKQAQNECSSKLEFRCNHCSVLFKQESRLIDHFHLYYTVFEVYSLFGEQIYKFKCKICGLVDVTFKSFQDHYLRCHTQIKCSLCNQWYKSLQQIEQHAFNDHKSFINNFECEFCQLQFTFKTSYEGHLKEKHCIVVEDKIRKCFLCDHEFNDDLDLTLEHLANHCNISLFTCDTCEFSTNSKADMISHTKIDSSDNQVLIANRLDLNELWYQLLKATKSVQDDYVVKNQLDEAIASIQLVNDEMSID